MSTRKSYYGYSTIYRKKDFNELSLKEKETCIEEIKLQNQLHIENEKHRKKVIFKKTIWTILGILLFFGLILLLNSCFK